jgi:rfaE bifunctional protein nucleotidyltransferase chain/domain
MTTVFTNGCFDLLHAGHLDLLRFARAQGDRLIVGLNSDASVGRLKGPGRPIVPQLERAGLLEALRCVHQVIVFDADSPTDLIEHLQPDILVKGPDYQGRHVAGAATVLARGGRVLVAPRTSWLSTSALIARVRFSLTSDL